jgi:hypothetical protein
MYSTGTRDSATRLCRTRRSQSAPRSLAWSAPRSLAWSAPRSLAWSAPRSLAWSAPRRKEPHSVLHSVSAVTVWCPLGGAPPSGTPLERFRQVYLILKRKAPLEPRSTCGTPTETLSQHESLSYSLSLESRPCGHGLNDAGVLRGELTPDLRRSGPSSASRGSRVSPKRSSTD